MPNQENITFSQKILDNMFIILALGILFPGIFYFAWGMIELFVFNTTPLSEYLQSSGLGQKLMGGN